MPDNSIPDKLPKMIQIGGQFPPQFLNKKGNWELTRGENGGYDMNTQIPVEVSEEPFEGSGNLTKEFTDEMTGLVISNDSDPNKPGAADLTFTVHGKTRTVKSSEVYEGKFRPFTTVTINSTVPWRAEALQTIGGIAVTPTPPDTTAPDDVTELRTTNVTATSLTLTWVASASLDTSGYDIDRGPNLIGSTSGINNTTYHVSGLSQRTEYTFTVHARDAAGNISAGLSITITTSDIVDVTPPENVTNLTTSNVTQTGVTLNFTTSASSDVASYDIYNDITFLANVTATTYNVNGLSADTAYTFWVKARDGAGNVASGTSVQVTTAKALPAAPTGLVATSGNAQVTLTWNTVTGATSYNVYRGGTKIASPTTATYTDTGLTNGTNYNYTVSAVNGAGESAQSGAKSATPINATGAYVSDSFNRGDTTSNVSLGVADTGQSWIYISGSLRIQGNKAKNVTISTSQQQIEAGHSDVTAKVTVTSFADPPTTSQNSLVLRATDGGNSLWFFTDTQSKKIILYKYADSALTSLKQVSDFTFTAPYTMKAVLSGSTIQCYINDVLQITHSETFNQTATKFGIANFNGNTEFDDFIVSP